MVDEDVAFLFVIAGVEWQEDDLCGWYLIAHVLQRPGDALYDVSVCCITVLVYRAAEADADGERFCGIWLMHKMTYKIF